MGRVLAHAEREPDDRRNPESPLRTRPGHRAAAHHAYLPCVQTGLRRNRRRLDDGRRCRPHLLSQGETMPLGGLQHYTIEPSDLERTKDFYCDVLGLENGDRPPLGFPGYWLYSGGVATVHLMGTRKPREGIVVRGTEKKYEDTGRFDHIAFAATDVDGVRKRLQSKNVKFRESIVPRTGATQIFLYDPDGVGVELNFPKI